MQMASCDNYKSVKTRMPFVSSLCNFFLSSHLILLIVTIDNVMLTNIFKCLAHAVQLLYSVSVTNDFSNVN